MRQHYKDGFGYVLDGNKLGVPNISGIMYPLDVGDRDMDVIVATGLLFVNFPKSITIFATNFCLNQ